MDAIIFPLCFERDFASLKAASVYFDRVFVLDPITVIEDWDSTCNQARRQEIIAEFGDTLPLSSVGLRIEGEQVLENSLAIYENCKVLSEAGIVTMMNPFDEFRSRGLYDHLRNLLRPCRREEAGVEVSLAFDDDSRRDKIREAVDLSRWLYQAGQEETGLMYANAGVFSCQGESDRQMIYPISKTGLHTIMNETAKLISVSRNAIPVALGQEAAELATSFQDIPWDLIRDRAFNGHLNYEDLANIRRIHNGLKITIKSLASELPSFEELHVEEILEFRLKYPDCLQQFRNKMMELATKVKALRNTPEYEQEILDVVHGTVTPAVENLRRSLRQLPRKFVNRIFSDVSSVAGLATFMASVHIGLPISKALLVSASVIGSKAAIATFLERQEILDDNGFALLLRLQKRR